MIIKHQLNYHLLINTYQYFVFIIIAKLVLFAYFQFYVTANKNRANDNKNEILITFLI